MTWTGNSRAGKDRSPENRAPLSGVLPSVSDVCTLIEKLFHSAPDMMTLVDADGIVLCANEAFTASLGFPNKELVGKPLISVLGIGNDEELRPETDFFLAQILDNKGKRRTLEVSLFPLAAELPFQGSMIVARDATAREIDRIALLESESRYRALFETSETPMVIIEEDSTISLANPAFEKLSGYRKDEVEGQMNWRSFIVEQELPRLEKYHMIRRIDPSAVPRSYESRVIDRNGTIHDISATVSMLPDMKKSVVALLDITRRKQLEHELLKGHKLESLALMASGIAHDFNNALTIILSSASLARQYAGPDSKAAEKLRETEKEIMRAKALTAQLLTFSRGGDPVRRALPIREIVRDTVRFALRGANVRAEFSIPDNLWLCDADSAQISQVLGNLIQNARQAMPDGGIVFVSAENAVIQHRQHHTLASGNYVLISIRDTGTGIPPEYLPRIFDPFFTTKKHASGLGLSTSYAIIKKHHGHIDVVSEPGVGSIFYLYLPASREQTSGQYAAPENDTRSGKILLMDEDETVRMNTVALLTAFGYAVTPSTNAVDAVDLFREAHAVGAPFDAVIIDLSLIGRSGGRECLRALHDIDHAVKVIAVSRFARFLDLSEYRHYGFFDVAQKPYEIERLHETLQQAVQA